VKFGKLKTINARGTEKGRDGPLPLTLPLPL
jgi:hypothetical protein